MDAVGYRLLKQLDAGLSPAVPDPTQALAAVLALTDTVTVDVAAVDIRTIVWTTFEWAGLGLLSEVRSFSTTAGDGKPPQQLVMAAMTAVDLLRSGRIILAADTAAWAAVLAELSAFVTAGVIAQSTSDKIAALRTVTLPKLRNAAGQPYAPTPPDLIAARSQF